MSRNIITASVMLVCLSAFIAAFAGWAWMGVQVYELRDTLAQRITDREAARTQSDYSETLRLLIRDTARERQALTTITNTSAIDFLAMMQDAADESGVELSVDAITPGTIEVGTVKKVPSLSVSVSSRDSFQRLYRLLVLFDALPAPLIIDEVSLEQEGSGQSSWTLRARLILYTESTQ